MVFMSKLIKEKTLKHPLKATAALADNTGTHRTSTGPRRPLCHLGSDNTPSSTYWSLGSFHSCYFDYSPALRILVQAMHSVYIFSDNFSLWLNDWSMTKKLLFTL